ncbi:unnamed protein product [Callosobruchus maculatus]|uniref:Uncharacterized protein n=1 Tax=Callosobruchus maculatus TaxID=64391 RepID=A0A653BJD6_CALMS|nr:unnamed protein product [Callosobruchus maculatus]
MALLNFFNRLSPPNLPKFFKVEVLQARFKSKKKPCKPRRDLVPVPLEDKDQNVWKMREASIKSDGK